MSGVMLEWALEEATPKDFVIGVLCQVMGQSPEEAYEWGDYVSPERIRDYCDRKGIRWGKLLEMDIERACSGQLPQFFLEHWLWADVYRVNHSVAYTSPSASFAPGERTLKPLSEYASDLRTRMSETPRRMGWACPQEQAHFYKSEEWQHCAAAYRYHDGYECRICHTRGETLHVHHRMPIISAYHYNFHLNFAWWKLEALCESCHRGLHNRTVRSTFDYSYLFVEAEQVKAEKKWLKEVFAKHHADGACQWCNKHDA